MRQLVQRATLLGAIDPSHYLSTVRFTKVDPLRGKTGFDPTHHQTSWDSAWENLKKAAGLPGLRFHDLRHAHITHAVESGVPIEVIMAQVGHVSAEMTRYYTHLGSNAKHIAVSEVQKKSSAALTVLGLGKSPPEPRAVVAVDGPPATIDARQPVGRAPAGCSRFNEAAAM